MRSCHDSRIDERYKGLDIGWLSLTRFDPNTFLGKLGSMSPRGAEGSTSDAY